MRVIVSLTTIPARLHDTHYGENGIYAGIKSLLEQDCSEYEIHFNIPYVYKMDNVEYIIPEWLEKLEQQYSFLKIYRMEDEGPLCKILPTIRRVEEPDAIIIVVDDDMRYRSNMVSEHVKNQQIYTRAALGYDGLDALQPFCDDVRNHYVSLVPENVQVKVLQHYKSVSYRREFFDELFTEFQQYIRTPLEKEMTKTPSDDILISAYMGYKNIPKIVMRYEQDTLPQNLEEWHMMVGTSFPLLGNVMYDGQQGANHPLYGEKFYAPVELYIKGYLER